MIVEEQQWLLLIGWLRRQCDSKSVNCKGQLISKGNFSVFNSPKNELENVNFCPSLLGQKCFVRFLGELKKKGPKLTDL